MITQIEIRKKQFGPALTLPLYSDENGFRVVDVEGLDPVQTSLVASSFGSVDGEDFQTSRRTPRNIRITLALSVGHPTLTIAEIRKNLYKWFGQKIALDLRFVSGDPAEPVYKIIGRVETAESAVFTKDPVMVISLICHQPSFTDTTETLFGAFSNTIASRFSLPYSGTVETGFLFTLIANQNINQIYLSNVGEDGDDPYISIQDISLINGDLLFINTTPGEKEVTMSRAGTETSLLHKMVPESRWINLHPGTNEFLVYYAGGSIPYTLQYYRKYGGL